MTRILSPAGLSRRQVLSGAGGLLAGLTGSAVAASMLMRMDQRPSVTMIGSGSSFSLLIASGGARLIILNGSDPADFGNALAQARVPFLDRTDIAFVARPTGNVTFIRSALERVQPERTYAMGSFDDLLDIGVSIDESLRNPTEFRLPRNVMLTLPHLPITGADEPAWTATITFGDRKLIIASGDHRWLPPVLPAEPAALIHLDGALPLEWIADVKPRLLAVPAAALSGVELREYEAAIDFAPFAWLRVHAGEATRLELGELGTS